MKIIKVVLKISMNLTVHTKVIGNFFKQSMKKILLKYQRIFNLRKN